MKKFFVSLILALIVIALVLVAAKDIAIKAFLKNLIRNEYGLELRIRSLRAGVAKPSFHIKGIILFNPGGFPDPVMLDMGEIFVRYDPRSLFTPRIHLNEMRLDLKECVVVKNRDGRLNISYLKLRKADEERDRPVKIPQIHIDRLRLKIGRALYKDYSKGGSAPTVKEFNINIDEEFEDVEDLYTLGRLVVARTLSNTYIPRLANFDIDSLNRVVGDVIKGSKDVLGKTGAVAQETLKGARETLDEVASGLKGILKTPFGRKEE